MKKFKTYSWFLYFSTPVLALVLGWAEWDWGKSAFLPFSALKLILLFGLFLAFTHFVLVLPLVHWVWKNQEGALSPFKLIAFSTVLLSLPLISFAYWWGEVRTILQAQEVTLSIIPAVVLSTLIYERRQKSGAWSFALASMIFFHLVLVNEFLGPFHTYLYLLAHDYRFEYLRALVPALTIALFYRLQYEPKGNSLLGVNAIHHAWKSSRFSQMLKSADPRKSSLKSESEP
jgi:hypothetical protein